MSNRSAASDTPLIIHSGSGGANLLSVVFIAMALLIWLYRPLLLCDHRVGTCTLNANDMPGNPQQVFAIAISDKAIIQTRQHSDMGAQSRVALQVAGKTLQIGAAWSADLTRAEKMAERINVFLNSGGADVLALTPDRGMHYGSLAFVAVALFLGLALAATSRRYHSLFDRSRDLYRIESRHLLRNRSTEGKLSSITGTLERAAGGGRRSQCQLGLLDTECQFHPLLIPGMPGGRKMRRTGARIRRLLALDDTRGLNYWDLKPKLGELANSIGRTAAQTQELITLQVELEADPYNTELLRQIALRLKRLGKGNEASALLRARHLALIEQDRRGEANLLAGIVWTMNL